LHAPRMASLRQREEGACGSRPCPLKGNVPTSPPTALNPPIGEPGKKSAATKKKMAISRRVYGRSETKFAEWRGLELCHDACASRVLNENKPRAPPDRPERATTQTYTARFILHALRDYANVGSSVLPIRARKFQPLRPRV